MAKRRSVRKSGPQRPKARARRVAAPSVRPARRRPEQLELIEDRAVAPLERVARAIVDKRDEVLAGSREVHALKQTCIDMMKKLGKSTYRHKDLLIVLLPAHEDVRVRVKAPNPTSTEANDEAHIEVEAALAAREAED